MRIYKENGTTVIEHNGAIYQGATTARIGPNDTVNYQVNGVDVANEPFTNIFPKTGATPIGVTASDVMTYHSNNLVFKTATGGSVVTSSRLIKLPTGIVDKALPIRLGVNFLQNGTEEVFSNVSVKDAFLSIYASKIAAGESFVTPAGISGNNGNSYATPKNYENAIRTDLRGIVNFQAGEYLITGNEMGFRQTDAAGGIAKILKADGPVTFRHPYDDISSLTWTDDGSNIWKTVLNTANKKIINLIDSTVLDLTGNPVPLMQYSSKAELIASGNGGYFHDYSLGVKSDLYVKYSDLSSVESIKDRLSIITGDVNSRFFVYGADILFEGDFQFLGLRLYDLDNATTPASMFFQAPERITPFLYVRPNVAYCLVHGLDANKGLTAFQNVWIHRSHGDNFHYVNVGTLTGTLTAVSRGIEVDCVSTYAGNSAGNSASNGTNNASANHGVSATLRKGGVYKYGNGPSIIDSGGHSLNVGCEADDSAFLTNNAGAITANGAIMYVYKCVAKGTNVNGFARDLRINSGSLTQFETEFATATDGVVTVTDSALIYEY